jgi:putative flavoprotein involved in K+ transport
LGIDPHRLLDLKAAGVGTVLWATGFGGTFDWLPTTVLDRNGVPAHDKGIGRTPGIYAIGFPWLSKRKSGIVYGVQEDAHRIADHNAKQSRHVAGTFSGGRRSRGLASSSAITPDLGGVTVTRGGEPPRGSC